MFHLRFVGKSLFTTVNVHAKRYDTLFVDDRGVVIVTVYDKSHSAEEGVEFRVGHEEEFKECFVTNEAGKTIDRIREPVLVGQVG